MKISRIVIFMALALCLTSTALVGCQSKKSDFSNARAVAELSTLECYYHNVAKYDRPADGTLFGIGNIGYKKMWFEYTAVINFGVDANAVEITGPDSNGVVTIVMPQAQVLGDVDIDETTMSDPLTDTGWFSGVTDEEKLNALQDAQQKLRDKANGEEELLFQARERAKTLLEQYVKNVGKEFGQNYTVKFVDPEE